MCHSISARLHSYQILLVLSVFVSKRVLFPMSHLLIVRVVRLHLLPLPDSEGRVSICNGQGQKIATISPLSLCMRTTPCKWGRSGFLHDAAMFACRLRDPSRECKHIKKPNTRQWPTHGKAAAGWGALLSRADPHTRCQRRV